MVYSPSDEISNGDLVRIAPDSTGGHMLAVAEAQVPAAAKRDAAPTRQMPTRGLGYSAQ